METEKIKLDTLVLTALIFLITIMADRYLVPYFKSMHLPVYAGLGLTRITGGIVILFIVFMMQHSLSIFGINKPAILKGIKRGVLWSAMFGLITAAGFLVIHLFGINPFKLFRTRLPSGQTETFFFFLTGGLIAPVLEELFFRGVVFNYLRRWGFVLALIISTTAFAGVHAGGGAIPITQIVGGLIFAVSYEKEKSILVPIIIHSSGNIAIFTLSLL